jgi:cardiolipin synthase A/B
VSRHRKLIGVIVATATTIAGALLLAQDKSTLRIESPLRVGDPRFPAYLAAQLNAPVTRGNVYTVLQNGDQFFPAMLDAIRNARERIEFESYIFSGSMGEAFTQALTDAARRGVQVRVVLDAFGVAIPPRRLSARIEASGARLAWFNGLSPWTIASTNYRTHRKILVADGMVAFTGGAGVADQWIGRAQDAEHWRDTQFSVTGPAVAAYEAAFFENWAESGGAPAPFLDPPNPPEGNANPSITVWSNATEGITDVKLMYLYAIAAAQHTVDIQSPYFLADSSFGTVMAAARQRGVRFRILTDGDVTDTKTVKQASRAEYDAMLRAGDQVFEFQPTMMHAKVMIVDGQLSVFGTANFDNRSFETNDELAIAAVDPALAATLRQAFDDDLKRSITWKADEWRNRPVYRKALEKFCAMFSEVF